ncbi:MAG: TonB-dependent receptor [Bacteroidota bacterium]
MKKNLTWLGVYPGRQFLKKMKVTVLLLFVSVASLLANDSYAQTTRLSLQLENYAITEVLQQVENQSEFRFFYNENVDLNQKVSVHVSEKTVFEVLKNVFEGTDIRYKTIGRQIALYKSGESPDVLVQQNTVSGKVTGQNGEPLPGVSVVIKGTTTGTVTNVDGDYSLNAQPDDVLVFSFIGMRKQEVPVDDRTSIDVIMEEETVGVEEVVVIGYGTREKKDLTGAVSQINTEEIERQNTLSPELAMQGKMAGVYISNPGSDPTARPSVQIRGVGTLGFNDPLYVIDGIPLTEGGASSSSARDQDIRGPVNVFSMINPNDIESISVLKDASATAIYGVRASNGVILITTKRGAEGKARIEMSARYGIQNNFKRYDMATIQEYVDWSIEAKEANPAYTPEWHYTLFDKSSPNYMGNSPDYTEEWVSAALVENAPVQDYNISISGGNQTSTYAAGAGYSNQQNVFFKNEFDRFSLFFNSDHQLTEWLKLGESYRFVYSNTDSNNGASLTTAFGVPWQPVYDSSGLNGYASPARNVDGSFQSYGYGAATRENFLGASEFVKNKRDLLRNLGTVYAELTPFDGFRVKGTVSFDYYTNIAETYEEMQRGIFEVDRGIPYPESSGNFYRRRLNDNINIVKEFLIGYSNRFGKHDIDIVLNAMDQRVKWNFTQMSVDANSPITSWEQRRLEEGWSGEDKRVLYERNRSGLQGYMGRLSYHFDSKYYLDATIRRDGTSKFGPGYKWGTFPSFAVAWRISSESFMEDLEWLDDLKIRAGWGQTGNQETRDYAFLSLVNMNPKAAFGSGDSPGNGIIYPASALGDFPIEDMSWETVTTSNFGFDAILLENKMTFTAEYYNRFTDGILQTISIPKVIGALNNPVVNLAQVENKGFEYQISYTDKKGELGYSLSANFTTVKNNVKKLYEGQPSTNGNSRVEEGYSINYIYGYKTDGLFQTEQEVADYQSKTTDTGYDAQKSPGDVKFVDLNGAPKDTDPEGAFKSYEPDGKIDAYDQTFLGKTIPGYYYGFSFNFDYKNWDANFNFRGVGDVQKINTLGKQSINGFGGHFLADYRDRWTPSNTSSSIPRAVQNDPAGNNRISDRHVEDAGFLRFQNFQIGYNFGGDVISRLGLNNLRCYVSGSNLFVISPYNDLDPENITTPTTFSVGANLSF